MSKRNRKTVRTTPKPQLSSNSIGSTLLDIVILVRGRFDILERCLASIPDAFQDIAYNVVIVDNATSEIVPADDVRAFYARMAGLYPNLTLVRSDKNLGFPAGSNLGARRKNSPILFFLNSDVILDPGSGNKLIAAMDNPEIGVAGMKLRFASVGEYTDAGLNPSIRPADKLQHVGLSVNVNGEVYHPFLGWDVDHPRVNMQFETFAVTGAALMIRRNSFIQAGGFYEGYGLGTYEDVDLCMTVRDQGKNVVVITDATAVHFTGATLEQLQTPFPLQQNGNMFRSRWMDKLIWWDFFIL